MNIFVLDEDPKLAALYHCDKHVIKMIVETAQMLSTAHHLMSHDVGRPMYRPTHVNHPANIWIRTIGDNYEWAYELFVYLAEQYELRYSKQHYSYTLLKDVLSVMPDDLESIGITTFAQCMPAQYKQPDTVQAYRKFYIGEKLRFATWRQPATIPPWIT